MFERFCIFYEFFAKRKGSKYWYHVDGHMRKEKVSMF